MAKFEIKKRTLNIFNNAWWMFMPGTIITVKWPVGTVRVPNGDNTGMIATSADPNDHYRPWLEANVGKQKWDWDWRIGNVVASNNVTYGYDTIEIKIRKSKAELATIAALKWS